METSSLERRADGGRERDAEAEEGAVYAEFLRTGI